MCWGGALPWVSNFSYELKANVAQNDHSIGPNHPDPMPLVTHCPI